MRSTTATKILGAAIAAALTLVVAHAPAAAQETAQPSWIVPDLLQAAKAEGALTVYGSMNEAEALPLWQQFQDATGVKVSYVRSSDSQIMARVEIENRGAPTQAGMSRSPPRFRNCRRNILPSSIRPRPAA